MLKLILLGLLLASGLLCGCTVVSANRVFPKLDWYWSRDAKMQRESAKEHAVTPAPSVLPNPLLSPGSINTNATVALLRSPAFIKQSRRVSEATKREVYRRYGMDPHKAPCPCEVDHIISLELGGDNSISNLFPQPYTGPWNARQKDQLENYLHRQVLKGKMSLADAQYSISHDWTNAYVQAGLNKPLKKVLFKLTHRREK